MAVFFVIKISKIKFNHKAHEEHEAFVLRDPRG